MAAQYQTPAVLHNALVLAVVARDSSAWAYSLLAFYQVLERGFHGTRDLPYGSFFIARLALDTL